MTFNSYCAILLYIVGLLMDTKIINWRINNNNLHNIYSFTSLCLMQLLSFLLICLWWILLVSSNDCVVIAIGHVSTINSSRKCSSSNSGNRCNTCSNISYSNSNRLITSSKTFCLLVFICLVLIPVVFINLHISWWLMHYSCWSFIFMWSSLMYDERSTSDLQRT